MISEEKRDKALTYLVDTDESCAKAHGYMLGMERQQKTIEAIAFLHAEGTVAERNAIAYSSQAYIEHVKKIENATYDYEAIRNRRLTAELIIETWRSENANRRKGNL